MIHDKPFRVRTGKRATEAWARRIFTAWAKLGWPKLMGIPAEQVHLARSFLRDIA